MRKEDEITAPTQDEIAAYVREAHRLRAEAVRDMLLGRGDDDTGAKSTARPLTKGEAAA